MKKLSILLLVLSTWLGASAQDKTPLFSFQGFGDSYIRGRGAVNPTSGGGFSQLAQTIPTVPATNFGVDGLNSDAINLNVWTLVQPSPQQPSAYLFNGGSNDFNNCGTTRGCLANFQEEVNASIARLAIPNQEQTWGSACTQTNGTWTADNSGVYVIPAPTYYLNPGTAVSTTTSGAILTCVVTSRAPSYKVGLNFQVTNAQTGTFTVTVDGQASPFDLCSGTTTFTSAPCGVNLSTNATAIFRQEFAGVLGTTHTVVITTTSAAKVDVTSVDTITPLAQANSNYVVVLGPNAGFDSNTGTYNGALQTVANQFANDGALVVFANQQSIFPGPGVNNTTDLSQTATANCNVSQSVTHPNDVCGYFHLAQTVVNATRQAGWNIFGTPRPFSNTLSGARVASSQCTGTATASATLSFFGLGGNSISCTGTVQSIGTIMTSAGTLSNLYVRCGNTGINTSSGVFTIHNLHGTVDTVTPITATFGTAANNTQVTDLTHTFAYLAGDVVRVEFTTQASETLAYCSVSFAY